MSNNFGRLLRQFREENDFNQETLARRLNVTQPTISNWESGKSWPNEREIQIIVRKLGISVKRSDGEGLPDLSKDNASQFGNWLRRARADKGWTQKELADRAGISSQTISLIENGFITSPQKATIKNLEQALGEKAVPEKEKQREIQETKDIGEYEEVDAASIDSVPERPGMSGKQIIYGEE
jgi:transcriptional regulator with XRE-family HTH domain